MSNLSTQVELHIRCIGLPKMDLLSKSDPFVVVYIDTSIDMKKQWKEAFRTKTLWNDQDPIFADQIPLKYQFEAMQHLRFEIYDRDSKKSEKLSSHDFIGYFETTMSKIMGSRGCTVSGPISKTGAKKFRGKIVISGQEMNSNGDVLTLQLRGGKVDRKNWFGFGKSDPFFVISQIRSDGSFVKVFESEVIKKNLNPVWKTQVIPVQRLCNGDYERLLRVEVFDWESNGSHQFIGSHQLTLTDLLKVSEFEVTNPKKKKNKTSGVIGVMKADVEKRPTFLEYVQGGLDMNLMVAVDFTASNGHPLDEISLHRLPKNFNYTGSVRNVTQLNQYQKAIWSVGRILEDYDTDKMIPVYGFGAEKDGQVSHCFPLTFNEEEDEVFGVEGIMTIYENALKKVNLSGPTYFKNILNHAKDLATKASTRDDQYVVLLILTDGIINDMDKSIKAIVESSTLPLSIIIVGIGGADFSNMEQLDGDDVRLSYMGKKAERDIVQFVPLDEFKDRSVSALAEEVLREVPEQLVSYFVSKDIQPKAKVEPNESHFNAFNDSVRNLKEEAGVPVAEVVVARQDKM